MQALFGRLEFESEGLFIGDVSYGQLLVPVDQTDNHSGHHRHVASVQCYSLFINVAVGSDLLTTVANPDLASQVQAVLSYHIDVIDLL